MNIKSLDHSSATTIINSLMQELEADAYYVFPHELVAKNGYRIRHRCSLSNASLLEKELPYSPSSSGDLLQDTELLLYDFAIKPNKEETYSVWAQVCKGCRTLFISDEIGLYEGVG